MSLLCCSIVCPIGILISFCALSVLLLICGIVALRLMLGYDKADIRVDYPF
jgi:hypothetical protein